MLLRGVAQRYANALFRAALKAGNEEQLVNEGLNFKAVLEANPDFKNFLLSPQVLTDAKKGILVRTLEGKASDLFLRFLQLLIDKKRFMFVEDIIVTFHHLYEKHVGIIEVKVITAIAMDGHIEQRLIGKLERETGKKIELQKVVDERIIGGMILIMEDNIIDGSVRHELQRMRRKLNEVRIN